MELCTQGGAAWPCWGGFSRADSWVQTEATSPQHLQIKTKPVPWEPSTHCRNLQECAGSQLFFLSNTSTCLTQPNDVLHAEAFLALFLLCFFLFLLFLQVSLSTLRIFSSPLTQFAPFALWIVSACVTSDYFYCPLYNLAFHIVFSTPVHTHLKH